MVQNHQGGYNSNSRKLQKKKAPLLRKLIHLGMLVVALLTAFFMGKSVGQITAKEQILEVVQASVSKQEYGAGNEKLLELLTGERTVKEDINSFVESSESEIEANVQVEEILDKQEKNNSFLWEVYPELILVNKENKLPEDYEVELKMLPDGTNKADEMAYDALTAMLKDGRKEGLAFEICSSYRSVERQQELLDEDIDALMRKGYTYKEAYAEVTMETMPPGYSEHATGLAFDIVALDYQMLDAKQEKTEENKWLRNHCAEYGFILRYPKEKEDITQISYESWHFRYVGKDAAEYIMEKEITLEEYLEEYLEGELDILE